MENYDLTLIICKLVAYLISSIVKSEKEYLEWGLPFIKLSIEAQFDERTISSNVLNEITLQFCPIIGQGISLYLEDKSTISSVEDNEYTFIHSTEHFLTNIFNAIGDYNQDIEKYIHVYMDNFFHHVVSNHIYEARTRVIAKKLCEVLHISITEFQELESYYYQRINQDNISKNDSESNYLFHEKFNIDTRTVSKLSILSSFRMLRVAFIAASGGAIMAFSGYLAAPAIVNSVVPIICASDSLMKVSIAFTNALTYIGFSSYEVIPGIISSIGTIEATKRMLHRTAPMSMVDFNLEPIIKHNDEIMKENNDFMNIKDQKAVNITTAAHVCILVCGHLEDNTTAMKIWGTRGYFNANGLNTCAADDCVHIPTTTTTTTTTVVISSPTTESNHGNTLNTQNHHPQIAAASSSSLISNIQKIILDTVEIGVEYTTNNLTTTSTCHSSSSISSSSNSGSTSQQDSITCIETVDDVANNCNLNNSHHECGSSSAATTTIHSANINTSLSINNNNNNNLENLSDWEDIEKDLIIDSESTSFLLEQQYILNWEPNILSNLSVTFQKILFDKVYSKLTGIVKNEILKLTPVPAITAAASLPLMILNKIKELDDPWVVAMDRAEQAGKLLAKVLYNQHVITHSISKDSNCSKRPITLIGYGMGARLIFHCLEALALKSEEDDIAKGIIENVVLIGIPMSTTISKWHLIRSVVSGRLVNCYATNDWILALLYRTKTYELGVAGLCPILLNNHNHIYSNNNNHTKQLDLKMNLSNMKHNKNNNNSNSINDNDDNNNLQNLQEMIEIKEEINEFNPNNYSNKDTIPIFYGKPQIRKVFIIPACDALMNNDIENIDVWVSHLITSHADYPYILPKILELVKL